LVCWVDLFFYARAASFSSNHPFSRRPPLPPQERENLSFISAIEDTVWGSLIILFSHNTRLNTIHIPDGEEEAFRKG
jgi:hypothetical protein